MRTFLALSVRRTFLVQSEMRTFIVQFVWQKKSLGRQKNFSIYRMITSDVSDYVTVGKNAIATQEINSNNYACV
jgi:hypothetical protein